MLLLFNETSINWHESMKDNHASSQAHKDHLDQLERVLEAGKVGSWCVYAGQEYLKWSPETYKLFDLPIGQPITYEQMLTYIHPEDRDWVNENWQLAISKGDYALVYRIISAKNKFKWIETFGDLTFDAQGNFVKAIGITRDITEQKETEAKKEDLTLFLKRSQKIGNLGNWMIESTSTFFELNDEAREMYGFPPGKPISIEEWMSTVHPEDRDLVMDSWGKAVQGKQDYDIEYRILFKDSIKWIKALGEMEFDDQGAFVQAIGIVKDITEQVNYQSDLRLARDQAEVANKLKSEFIANMSHEIRTPLNGVIGFSELLMNTKLDDRQQQYMTAVHQSAQSLIGLVNDILDFSKIEAGKLELTKDNVDLLDLVQQVKNITRYQARSKDIILEVNVAAGVPDLVQIDGFRLQQVLINLMSNAIKFTSQGLVKLNVEILNAGDTSSSNTYRFSVQDTGIGISEESCDKIFEAFTQEDSSFTKKFGGTGLGLSISNGILKLMNSYLQLESKLGKGSLFYFDLELRSSQNNLNSTDSNAPIKETKNDAINDQNIKILVVEDNKLNRYLTKVLILKNFPNATIMEAQNGQEGVELFAKTNPDLVVMDIQMPLLNGYEATSKIRQLESKNPSEKRTPILAVTAGILKDNKDKCLEAGMDDFMTKPIVNQTLQKYLSKWIST